MSYPDNANFRGTPYETVRQNYQPERDALVAALNAVEAVEKIATARITSILTEAAKDSPVAARMLAEEARTTTPEDTLAAYALDGISDYARAPLQAALDEVEASG